jgi:translation initiation factor IF-3
MKNFFTNSNITDPMVLVINPDGSSLGVLSIREALQKADDLGLDLIKIDPNKKPPICKIANYSKYKFDLEKKEKLLAKGSKHELHEIQIHPKCAEADLAVKARKVIEFLQKGDDVKFKVQFKGREMVHQEIGEQTLEALLAKIPIPYNIKQAKTKEGKNIFLTIGKK